MDTPESLGPSSPFKPKWQLFWNQDSDISLLLKLQKEGFFSFAIMSFIFNMKYWILNRRKERLQSHTRLQIFFQFGGPKWCTEPKMVRHFLRWWAQAYQTNHSWHLGSVLYLQTLVCICTLTADDAVKPFLSGHWKVKTKYCFMRIKCTLQHFWPSFSYHLSFLSGYLRYVLLFWLHTCTFCFVEFIDSLYDEYFY